METRKRVWIAVLCLLSAAVLTISLRHHVVHVQAATLPTHAAPTTTTAPTPHVANAALRAAAVNDAILLDDVDATRVTGTKDRIAFPPVEQFTLTPPNPAAGINETTVAVRFAAGAEKLPIRFPMLLGTQRVMVDRSQEAPDTYVTDMNFDWNAFAEEQAQRREAAAHGKMVPVFHGRHFIRTEPMQFVDPAQIESAQQSHQPLQLSPEMLTGGTLNLTNDHVLMITAIPVVEDQQRTFDQCLPAGQQGNPAGAWTFNTLMQGISCSFGAGSCTQQAAENMLLSMLSKWQSQQTVNTFQVPARNIGVLGQSGLLANWPIDTNLASSCTLNGQPSPCPSLPDAPVHLLAIVNRIDLGQNFPPFNTPNPPGGELRFVFNVTADTTPGDGACSATSHGSNPFTIILEFNVPSSFTAQAWANQWNMLQDPTNNFGTTYRSGLQSLITNQVVTAGACTNLAGNSVSCLAQIRTNEIEITNNGLWEQRQFQLNPTLLANNSPNLAMATVSMTPDSSFDFQPDPQLKCGSHVTGIHACNNGLFMKAWVDNNTTEILASDGALPIVTADVTNNAQPPATDPFLGGSAFNDANAFWVDAQPTNNEQARSDFSLNTCNGCHGGETRTPFLQINPRAAGTGNDQPSALANFLLGCVPSTGSCGTAPATSCTLGQCTINTPGQIQVTDPNNNQVQNVFGDILRREGYLGGLVSNGPGSGGMLLPFLAQPVGVH